MAKINNISPVMLQTWLESGEAVLVDVRELLEYKEEHIAEARNLPLSDVTLDNARLPENRDKKLVIHCKSGRRSMIACEKLVKDGAQYDIWNLEGGIQAWKEAGLPIANSDKKTLPLERQVFIFIGFMVLVGVIGGYLFSDAWYLLALLAGCGMVNSGLTGWCGMAKLVAKMPWNKG